MPTATTNAARASGAGRPTSKTAKKTKATTERKSTRTKPFRKIDNPLLQSTLHSPSVVLPPTQLEEFESEPELEPELESALEPELESELEPVRKEVARETGHSARRAKAKYVMSPDEETLSVLEIISDLEKQLDAAFSIKDAQEEELATLKQQLEQAELASAALEGRVEEFEVALVSQEELNSQLEFLEDARLEASEKIRSLEEDIKLKSASITELEQEAQLRGAEMEARDTRVEQLELELSSASATIQSFQDQISVLEQEQEDLSDRLEGTESELREAIADRDTAKKGLEKSTASLGEIRQMLTQTRAKARKHYYKSSRKTGGE